MRSVLLFLVFLALSAPAFGSDGVLEINQTCAVEIGCFVGDSAGLPVTIAETGSYRLTSGLDVSIDTTGIEITAQDVSLDLNGFAIRGGAVCAGDPPSSCTGSFGAGVVATGEGAWVLGGTVRGFGDGGVVLTDDARIDRVEAIRNGRVGLEVGRRGRIRDSHASANAGIGLAVGADGSVRDSLATGNAGVPVALGLGAGISDSTMMTSGATFLTGGLLLSDNICNATTSCTRACTDSDGDGFYQDCLPVDCDDGESQSYPMFPELCDGIDNDCNGLIDDDCGGGTLGEGEVCTTMPNECQPGLLCCYPCGLPGCENRCIQPALGGGCPFFP